MAKQILTDRTVADLQSKDKPYELSDNACAGLLVRVEKSGAKNWWVYLWTPDSSGKRQRYRWKIGPADVDGGLRLFSKTRSPAERKVSVRYIAEGLRTESREVDLRQRKQEAVAAAEADQYATLRAYIDGPYLQYCIETGITEPEKTVRWLKSVFSGLVDQRVDGINYLHIRRWIKQAEKTRKPATIHRLLLGSLSSVLSLAIEQGTIEKHPLQASERNRKASKIVLPKVEKRRDRYLSEAEEKRLRDTLTARDQRLKIKRANYIQHCEGREGIEPPAPLDGAYSDYVSPLVLLALNTGIRRGGLLGLRWSDIESNTIHVPVNLDKGGRGYSVPLSKEARQVIRLWRRQSIGEGLVFPNPRTGEVIRSIKTVWGSLMREAKISGFRYHDLRHSFASKLVTAGVPLYTVQQLLGHSSIKMTERYSHLSPDHMADALKALDA